MRSAAPADVRGGSAGCGWRGGEAPLRHRPPCDPADVCR